jgi:hypothetical protein
MSNRNAGFAIDMTQPGTPERVRLIVLKGRLKLEMSWLKNIGGEDANMRYTVRRAKEIFGIPTSKRMTRKHLLELVESELESLDKPPTEA